MFDKKPDEKKIETAEELAKVLEMLPANKRVEVAKQHVNEVEVKIATVEDLLTVLRALPDENRLYMAQMHRNVIVGDVQREQVRNQLPKDDRGTFDDDFSGPGVGPGPG